MIQEIKWCHVNDNGITRINKQHAFIAITSQRERTKEKYKGNQAICRSSTFHSPDGYEPTPWAEMNGEERKDDCCQQCLRILSKKQ